MSRQIKSEITSSSKMSLDSNLAMSSNLNNNIGVNINSRKASSPNLQSTISNESVQSLPPAPPPPPPHHKHAVPNNNSQFLQSSSTANSQVHSVSSAHHVASAPQVSQAPQIPPIPQLPSKNQQIPVNSGYSNLNTGQIPGQVPVPGQPPKLEKLKPGTILTVGKHKVSIVKYLSEGGYAHIYVVKFDSKHNGNDIACLKRVIVPNKEGLNQLRAEVEVMQRLSNSENIVQYFDSNASRLANSSNCYEVLVLMELCSNKSLLDFMNSRLATKLTELEILKIMLDISKAIYNMHKIKLIHRDIKIENVLLDSEFNFKLCDFGSTCPILRVPKNQQEFQILHNDLLHQTTPQYRSPEMLDLYRGLPIDEKSDIWAFGVFLYKLCYYTTPFENVGELGILHAAYKFPVQPIYSKNLKNLINLMLQENPNFRPNIYQILVEICKIIGIDEKINGYEDIYGLGTYKYPPLEQIHPSIEPFTASLVPMFSPFKSTPRDPIEVQMELNKRMLHQKQQQQQQQLQQQQQHQHLQQQPSQQSLQQPLQQPLQQQPLQSLPPLQQSQPSSPHISTSNSSNSLPNGYKNRLSDSVSPELTLPKVQISSELSSTGNFEIDDEKILNEMNEKFPEIYISKNSSSVSVNNNNNNNNATESNLSLNGKSVKSNYSNRWSTNNPFPNLQFQRNQITGNSVISFEDVEDSLIDMNDANELKSNKNRLRSLSSEQLKEEVVDLSDDADEGFDFKKTEIEEPDTNVDIPKLPKHPHPKGKPSGSSSDLISTTLNKE